jgi:hypothetical protein
MTTALGCPFFVVILSEAKDRCTGQRSFVASLPQDDGDGHEPSAESRPSGTQVVITSGD